MRKAYWVVLILFIFIILVSFKTTDAGLSFSALTNPSSAITANSGLLTKSFGGTVFLAPIPGVTCTGTGKSALLSSNVQGLVSAVSAVTNSSTKNKALRAVAGIYNFIPVYATDISRSPYPMGQILGKEKMIPSFTTCYISAFGGIPIPVLKTTDNYGVTTKIKL